MQNSVRDLMLAQVAFIVALEEHADQLAPTIATLRDGGDAMGADALLNLARMHRVRALQTRGQLAVLADRNHSAIEPEG